MNEAYVIRPEERKSKCKCCLCKMEYSPKQYETLFEAKKIIFMSFLPPKLKRPKTVCHACLLTLVKSYDKKGASKITVEIIDNFRKTSWTCFSYSTDIPTTMPILDFFP